MYSMELSTIVIISTILMEASIKAENTITCTTNDPECTTVDSPCINDGICCMQQGKAVCDCGATHYGDTFCHKCVSKECDGFKDLCDPSPCQNGGTCMMSGAHRYCKCLAGFTGGFCEKTYTCQNGGTATDGYSSSRARCICPPAEASGLIPFLGHACENPNPCRLKPCGFYACAPYQTNDYRCNCGDNKWMKQCNGISPCGDNSHQCKNGGICKRYYGSPERQYKYVGTGRSMQSYQETTAGSKTEFVNYDRQWQSNWYRYPVKEYSCDCEKTDYTCDTCQHKRTCPNDPQTNKPRCLNGGMCQQDCSVANKFKCICPINFGGDRCEDWLGATCFVYGDPMMIGFSSSFSYPYHATCDHVLTKTCVSASQWPKEVPVFQISARHVNCLSNDAAPGNACAHKVEIEVDDGKIALILNAGLIKVEVNGDTYAYKDLPYIKKSTKGFTLVEVQADSTMPFERMRIQTDWGLTISLSISRQIRVVMNQELTGKLIGKVCGACGPLDPGKVPISATGAFGTSVVNDKAFIERNLIRPQSPPGCDPYENGLSPLINGGAIGKRKKRAVPAPSFILKNGSLVCNSTEQLKKAVDGCAIINDKNGPFGLCYDKNDHREPMYQQCIFDICVADMRCATLEGYSKQCGRVGSFGDWRSQTGCKQSCQPGQVLKRGVRTNCIRTCNNMNPCPEIEGRVYKETFDEGCVCREGLIWDSTSAACIQEHLCNKTVPNFPPDFGDETIPIITTPQNCACVFMAPAPSGCTYSIEYDHNNCPVKWGLDCKATACSPKCGRNEEYQKCGHSCNATCAQPDLLCNTTCMPGCVCIAGHVRSQNGTCIPLDQCPSNEQCKCPILARPPPNCKYIVQYDGHNCPIKWDLDCKAANCTSSSPFTTTTTALIPARNNSLCSDVNVLRQTMLGAHNMYREAHGVSPLVLDSALNRNAQDWAQQWADAHKFTDRFRVYQKTVGYNLAEIDVVPIDAQLVARNLSLVWYGDRSKYDYNYDYSKNPENRLPCFCTRFLQMIWKSASKIGVGCAMNTDGKSVTVVANYDEKQNIFNVTENVLPKIDH